MAVGYQGMRVNRRHRTHRPGEPGRPIGSGLPLAFFLLCAACGDGGGGDSGSADEGLLLSSYSVTVTEPVTSGANLEERITVTLQNPRTADRTVRFSYSTNGLSNVSGTRDRGELELVLQFNQPLDLRPGIYNDTVRVEVCTDATCSRVVPNLAATASVRFTVIAVDNLNAALSNDSVDLQAFVTDPFVPGASDLELTVDGVSVQPFVDVAWTESAIVNAWVGMTQLTRGMVRYSLRSPDELGPGMFEDTVTITVCLDRLCVNPVPPNPLILGVKVAVTDTLGGPNGYTVRITDVTGTRIAWDRTRQLIYVARPDPTNAELDHNILLFDPVAGQVATTVPMTWHPGPMAISDDDQFLYVGTASTEDQLKRLRLADLAEDASIDLGSNAQGFPYAARELAVAPSESLVVAMGRTIHPGGENTAGLVIFDDTAPRSQIVGAVPDLENGPVIDHITWGADDTRIFASNDSGEVPEVYEIAVDASGGQVLRATPAETRGRLHFGGGYLYTDNGLVFDATTLTQVARLVPQQDGTDGELWRVFVHPPTNRIYAIARFLQLPFDGFNWPISLVSFDLTTRNQIAAVPLDTRRLFHQGDIARWGSDGLVLLSPGDPLVLINGPFVAP